MRLPTKVAWKIALISALVSALVAWAATTTAAHPGEVVIGALIPWMWTFLAFAAAGRAPETASALLALRAAEVVTFEAGACILEEGAPATCMYLVAKGCLRVSRLDEYGAEIEVATLGPGAVVGEQGLLSGQPRNASVDAVEETTLLRLDSAAFSQLIRSSQATRAEIEDVASAREPTSSATGRR